MIYHWFYSVFKCVINYINYIWQIDETDWIYSHIFSCFYLLLFLLEYWICVLNVNMNVHLDCVSAVGELKHFHYSVMQEYLWHLRLFQKKLFHVFLEQEIPECVRLYSYTLSAMLSMRVYNKQYHYIHNRISNAMKTFVSVILSELLRSNWKADWFLFLVLRKYTNRHLLS